MKKNNIKEHQDQGIYGRSQGFVEDSEDDLDSTIGHDVPIEPGQQMTNQLSVSRPPIEDDKFVPGSLEELSRAAAAISENVPAEEIEWYYRQLHKLLDSAADRAGQESSEDKKLEKEVQVKEESIRSVIRKSLKSMLKEQFGSRTDEEEFDEYRDTGIDYFGSQESSLDDQPSLEVSSDEISLDDMAAEFGFSGASGMRQEILRITDRLEYFVAKIKKDDLDALMDYAAGEYLDAMEEAELLDPEDLSDLKMSSRSVKEMDSFRFFFVSAFVLPAYREVARDAGKRIKAEMSDLGLPEEIHQTLLNQVTGSARKKPEQIKKKLEALVKKGDLKPEQVKELLEKIRNAYAVLQSVSELGDDLVQKSLDKWQSTPKSKKKSLLRQALEQSSEVQA